MPKSKRNKQVELSKTRKQGLERKKHLYNEIRNCVDKYDNIFIFSVGDMRNAKMKEVREQWKDSRFFIGKNKVMAMALGRSEEEECRPGLHKIGERLKGEKGLLFSSRTPDEVIRWFESHTDSDFARSGNAATENVFLSEGPLPQFPHSLESYLRQLGLPTTLQKGIVHLVKDYEVCKEGDILTPESARVLKLLGYMMAEFQVKIECVWSKDGTFQNLMPESEDLESKENAGGRKSSPKKRKLSHRMELDEPESMEIAEETDIKLVDEPKAKKSRQEERIESEDQSDEDEKQDEEEVDEEEVDAEEEDEEEEEEVQDKSSILKLTEKKLEDSGKKPTKYSPKMTRSRAAAAKKNVTSEEVVNKPEPVRKTTRKRKA